MTGTLSAWTGLALQPLVPDWVLIAALAIALPTLALGIFRRARGAWLRALAVTAVLIALVNPQVVEEDRVPHRDVAVVLVDDSPSLSVRDRRAQADQAAAEVAKRLATLPGLDVRIERGGNEPGGEGGTRLFTALSRVTADLPDRRIAGVVMITDGQVHDVPKADDPATPDFPVHVLLAGEKGETDRRLIVEKQPKFGLVGRSVSVTVRVEDSAAPTGGAIAARLRAGDGSERPVVLRNGQSTELRLPLEHAGTNVLEVIVDQREGELSTANNAAAIAVNGVRDRLRVLLISGEPHVGERAWRNLLKADANVDLIHFTILRPPTKDDLTPLRELALINFPIRELFEVKLDDFDLVVFDRYSRRGLIPDIYLDNIARYVRDGGALLLAVGPEFAQGMSLSDSPLARVMPAGPTGRVLAEPFKPAPTDIARRHPVTGGLWEGQDPRWGRWVRQVEANARRGNVLLTGANGGPLLLLDRVEKGRVALILSDTMWLWGKGFEGGGPQAELLRRVSHWLMGEPELEENALRARVSGDRLEITRRSLEPRPEEVSVTGPFGEKTTVPLTEQPDGRAVASLPARQPGIHRLSDGTLSAVAAVGDPNPLESSALAATEALLRPAVEATGGGDFWISGDGIPEVRRTAPDSVMAGRGWIGFRENRDYSVAGIRLAPLLPIPLLLALTLGGLMAAWWREGR